MIKKIHIQGYKTLHDCEVELGNLTVLIGENASGKTNFLNAVQTLCQRLENTNVSSDINNFFRALSETRESVSMKAYGETGLAEYPVYEIWFQARNIKPHSFNPDFGALLMAHREYSVRAEDYLSQSGVDMPIGENGREGYFTNEPQKLARFLLPARFYRIDTHLEADSRHPQPVAPALYLEEGGDNLVNVLFRYFNDDAFKAEVKKILKYVVPDFENLIIDSPAGNFVNLTWKEKYLKRDLYASDLSDGTLKLLCLCAILCSNTIVEPPKLIAIDEPDIGLHPRLFKLLAELIESKAKESQIIITTHSPEFLSYFKLEQILTVRRENGKSIFERPATKAHLKKMLENYETSIGELWLSGELGDTTVKVDAP